MSSTTTATPAAPPAAAPAPKKRRGGVLSAAAWLFASLAAAEVALHALKPLPDPYAELKRIPGLNAPASPYVPSAFPPHMDLRFTAEPGLPGMDGKPGRFTTNGLGFRGDSLAIPRPAGELRVFVVGGSTTECIFLDDTEAVTAVLQRRLNQGRAGAPVKVYGAGKSGDRSWDHVAMVAHRVAHLQPDVIVVFAGINDVAAAAARRDYLLRGPTERDGRKLSLLWMARLAATELQLPRLVHAVVASSHGEHPTVSSYREAVAKQARIPAAGTPPREDVAPYAENLASLAGIARANGVKLVFMTQATTWNSPDPRAREWHWMTGRAERYTEAQMDAAMERYNDAMRRVGAEQGVPVFDLARAVPKSMDYFYDDVHFNVRGADTAATLLARFLAEQGVVPPPAR
jgi:lysophospholipase L1-like esterase